MSTLMSGTKQDQDQPNVAPKANVTSTTKAGITVKVRALDDVQSISSNNSEIGHPSWDAAGFLRLGPLAGLASLALVLKLLAASFLVLHISDGEDVLKWKPWSPTVWLAIFTAISNKALAFAALHGVIISWWQKAAQGTTLDSLHTDWSYSLHAWNALTAGRRFNALALVSLCATLVAVDGPLLQRASSMHAVERTPPVSLAIAMTPELLSYWSGNNVLNPTGYILPGKTLSEGSFEDVLGDYAASKPIRGVLNGCAGTCSATVLAPALATLSCWSFNVYHNYSRPLSPALINETWTDGLFFPKPERDPMFGIYVTGDGFGHHEKLRLRTWTSGLQVSRTCAGPVNVTTCEFASAIAEYSVMSTNGILTFDEPTALSQPAIKAIANNTILNYRTIHEFHLGQHSGQDGAWQTTLGGIEDATIQKWQSYISAISWPDLAKGASLTTTTSGWVARKYTSNFAAWSSGQTCLPEFRDPMPDVSAWINELMFRAGAYTAQRYNDTYMEPLLDKGLRSHYNVTGTKFDQVTVFDTNMSYFAGAAVVQIFSVLAILYTYYGWWTLGWRKGSVSFSPLELAKAFNAPLLRDVPPDLPGRKMADLCKDVEVQFGGTHRSVSGGDGSPLDSMEETLCFEQPKRVERPIGRELSVLRALRSFTARTQWARSRKNSRA